MPTATLRNAVIRYDLSGSGDPTVLVHGSLVDRTSWDAIRPGLAQSLHLLAYDRRGHGESRGPPRSHPVRDDATDLAELLEQLDLYPVHLIAHSYGGAVALRLAVDRPEMVRSVALHEPPFVGLLDDDPATAPEAERLREGTHAIQLLARQGATVAAAREIVNAFSVEEGAWDRLRPEVQQGLLRHIDRWTEEIGDPEATQPDRAVLADLLIPVLLTTGERSPPFLHRITNLLAGRLRNSTVRTIPGVGHAPHVSDPDLFIAVVHGFLVERNVPST
ncbi:MAG: alpha/beta fold hydrolase [Candidatus Lutacidiplasmatales archaeon]|nr:alpha/beta hydrolase [Thermoplasmata archaeon]